MFNTLTKHLSTLKTKNPVILNLTNVVTMDFIANGLLSLGASPIMSQAKEELVDLIHIAQAVVINIGTLDDEFLKLADFAAQTANKLKKPIVLDPVGVGASRYRTNAARELLNNFNIAIIRGNASEIMALVDTSAKTKGVDSSMDGSDVVETAKSLAEKYQTTIVMSGKTDYIIEGNRVNQIKRGAEMMANVTGMGCLLSAVVAAFHATEPNRFLAAYHAALFYGVCGEVAAQKSSAPGSFKIQFIDALHVIPSQENYENK